MEKKKLYIDMDGVLCNYEKAHNEDLLNNPRQPYPQSQWGFFAKLEEIPNAIESLRTLEKKYDVWILTRPSFFNINCFSEKAQWVKEHIGFDILKKTILCGDKSLLKGDYLIDDQSNCGQLEFEGEWIEFGSINFPNWDSIIKYLITE